MAHFLQCSTPDITYLRGEKVVNHPVNIDLCTKLRKSALRWYPDNAGRASIEFDGCDARWAFETTAQRDAEYDRILALTNGVRRSE